MTNIIKYYAAYDENARLTKDKLHYSEYLITMKLLRKYISGGSYLLDCCAGTGIYAFALASEGQRVAAGDLVP